MADEPVVHFGDNSHEGVAFKLLNIIRAQDEVKGRQPILDLYAECLLAVRDPLQTREGKYRNPQRH